MDPERARAAHTNFLSVPVDGRTAPRLVDCMDPAGCSHPWPEGDRSWDAWDRVLHALPFEWCLAPYQVLGAGQNVVIAYASPNWPWPGPTYRLAIGPDPIALLDLLADVLEDCPSMRKAHFVH